MDGLSAVNLLSAIIGVIINLAGLAVIAVKVEHRLTVMETHIKHLLIKNNVDIS